MTYHSKILENEYGKRVPRNPSEQINSQWVQWLIKKLDVKPSTICAKGGPGVRTVQIIHSWNARNPYEANIQSIDRLAFAFANLVRDKKGLSPDVPSDIDELVRAIMNLGPLTKSQLDFINMPSGAAPKRKSKSRSYVVEIQDTEASLREILKLIDSKYHHSEWWRLDHTRDQYQSEHKQAYVTIEIGATQKDKREDPSKRLNLVSGDDDFLLESTFEVMDSAIYRYHDLNLVCEAIVQVLYHLRDLEASHAATERPFNLGRYLLQITDAVNPRVCYIFLLYWTYRRIRTSEPNDDREVVSDLLKRYMLFRFLVVYPRGINTKFVAFNKDYFPEGFQNTLWQKRVIETGDTIRRIIRKHYKDVHRKDSFEECVRALRDYNEPLRAFGIDDDLTDLIGTQITIAAPRDHVYQQVIAEHNLPRGQTKMPSRPKKRRGNS